MPGLTPQTEYVVHSSAASWAAARHAAATLLLVTPRLSLPSSAFTASLCYPEVKVNVSYVLPDSDVQLRQRGLPAYLRGDRPRPQVFMPHEVCPAQRWKDLCR